jgi:monoamine oxidase
VEPAPHIPGCDVAFALGQLTRHGPFLRQRHGRVQFAGAERSTWPNNMEGAVESGTRILQQLIGSITR